MHILPRNPISQSSSFVKLFPNDEAHNSIEERGGICDVKNITNFVSVGLYDVKDDSTQYFVRKILQLNHGMARTIHKLRSLTLGKCKCNESFGSLTANSRSRTDLFSATLIIQSCRLSIVYD